jgi:hypothetical protein
MCIEDDPNQPYIRCRKLKIKCKSGKTATGKMSKLVDSRKKSAASTATSAGGATSPSAGSGKVRKRARSGLRPSSPAPQSRS